MQLQEAIRNVFVQLNNALEQLSEPEYVQPSKVLFQATIGQHVRHIIELFICLNEGYTSGVVNYENRKRNYLIESDKQLAAELLKNIYAGLLKEDKALLLEAGYDDHSDDTIQVQSNYYRELVYNLEHTVHHMALIRVGIADVSQINIPEGFGVASSTLKYRQACAQ